MSKRMIVVMAAVVLCAAMAAPADDFGTGANQFTIDFVTISGATNPTSGYGIVNNDYRMGTYEITNDQWSKFQTSLGVPVTGSPATAYNASPLWTGTNVPTNNVSWYEAAQFVNYLNTSTGHHAAYNFTGTQGTGNYAMAVWSAAEADGGTNLYRHKDAFYFLPTKDEWLKAGYWNGATLQTHATKPGETLYQGNGSNGGWNYRDGDYGPDGPAEGPWNVGSGSEELNGTFDMMGNVWEWMENPTTPGDYSVGSTRGLRGGCYEADYGLAYSSWSESSWPDGEGYPVGFRVASVPEPCSLGLLSLGGLALLRPRK